MTTLTSLETTLETAASEGVLPNFARWAKFLGYREGDWLELQALGVRSSYGERVKFAHANSFEGALSLLEAAERLPASGLYCIANRINDAVTTRREPGRWHDAGKGACTSDRDIVARRVVFIDIDARRPSGTSATDEEVARTIPIANAIYEQLASLLGDDASIGFAHSGNGRQLFLALDERIESEETATLIRDLLSTLSSLHSTNDVHVDGSVGDAKRLVPAFGTMKRKGACGIAHRPHRRTAFLCRDAVRRLSLGELTDLHEQVAALAPKQADATLAVAFARETRPPRLKWFDDANAVPIVDVAQKLGLFDGETLHCPGCQSEDGVAFVGNGLKCHHASCSGKGYVKTPGFRTAVDLVAEVCRVSPHEAARRLNGWSSNAARRLDRSPTHGFAPTPSAPTRILLNPEERLVTGQAIAALAHGGADIFQRGGALVQVLEGGRIASLATPTLREWMAHCAEWIEVRERNGERKEVGVHPPRWCVNSVHARGRWDGIRHLRAVVEFPILRPDGTILQEPGYDAATQLFYAPNAAYEQVAERPAEDDAKQARDALRDALRDFSFKTEAHLAACLAALLTPLARPAFKGAIPSVVIDGNVPGAERELLARVLATIVTGRELDVRSGMREVRKRATSSARTPYVLIGNVTLDRDGVDALTHSSADRGMGSCTSLGSMWIFDNLHVRDLQCLHLRLESERAEKRFDAVLPWVRQHRARLVTAALTILRGYVAAGLPAVTDTAWGGFEAWSRIVRQAVVWCGLPDPCSGPKRRDEGETGALAELLEGWADVVRDIGGTKQGCTVAEVLDRLGKERDRRTGPYARLRDALAALIPTPPGILPNAARLGCLLRRFRGHVADGKTLTCTTYAGNNVWRVSSAPPSVGSRLRGSHQTCLPEGGAA